jgi:Gpi18-like mannosyltransferase
VLKILCAATTLGTVDITSFAEFGAAILQEGMPALYRREPLFNHMPLVGGYSALLYALVGDQQRLFGLLLRLPGIAADLITVAVLIRRLPLTVPSVRWAMFLFALSPVSFMVTGFHGNVDPILVCLLVLTTAACADGRLVASAVFYALACNIKSPAVLLGPGIFLLLDRTRPRDTVRARSRCADRPRLVVSAARLPARVPPKRLRLQQLLGHLGDYLLAVAHGP